MMITVECEDRGVAARARRVRGRVELLLYTSSPPMSTIRSPRIRIIHDRQHTSKSVQRGRPEDVVNDELVAVCQRNRQGVFSVR